MLFRSHVELRQAIADAAGLRPLKDQVLVLRRMQCYFLDAHLYLIAVVIFSDE